MRRVAPLALALVCSTVLVSPARGEVVGGTAATQPWPHMAALERADRNTGQFDFTCGASLVRPEWVLTAAHCVDGDENRPDRFRVQLGTAKRSAGGERIDVAQVAQHEGFGTGMSGASNDVALLRLSRPAAQGTPIRIAAPTERNLWRAGTEATAIGWGAETFVVGDVSDGLREVKVPIVSDDDCRAAYPVDFDAKSMLCAGRREGGRDTCQGDSGGPLMVPDGAGGWLQVGVVSSGTGCGLPLQYGIYARVADTGLRGWLEQRLGPDPAAPASPVAAPPATAASSSSSVRAARPRLRVTRVKTARRSVALRLSATRPVRSVRVTLLRGKRVVARVTRTRVTRVARLVLRPRRPLPAGRLTLRVSARDASGRAVTTRHATRLRARAMADRPSS